MEKIRFEKQFNYYWAVGAGIIFILLDQIVKFLISKFYPQLANKNNAIIFGFVDNRFLIILFLLIGFSVLYFLYKDWKRLNLLSQLGLVLITSGAISNVFDRIFYGGAIDYLHFRLWSSFNLADIFITIGIVLYIWQFFNFNTTKNTTKKLDK